jgi:hypothetical protein
MGVHETGRDQRVRQLDERRSRRDPARQHGGRSDRPDSTGLPPDRVAGDSWREGEDPLGAEETAGRTGVWGPKTDAIHMWKSGQSEYPGRRLEFENG